MSTRTHQHGPFKGTGAGRQPMTINIFALANAFLLAAGMVYLAAAF